MRIISVGIMFNATFGRQRVLDLFQKEFYQSTMHNYQAIQPKNSSEVLFFWEKLNIDDNYDTRVLKIKLEKSITDSIVFVNELIPSSKSNKYMNITVSAIIALTAIIVGQF